MWDWLSDNDVMNAIGFYAGGAATAIGGLWVAFTKFRALPAQSTRAPSRATVRADHVVAGGRDVSVSGDVTIATTPKAAWIVLGIGVLALAGTAIFSGGSITVTTGAVIGGDVNGSTINIGQ